jgi:hypothetical protein
MRQSGRCRRAGASAAPCPELTCGRRSGVKDAVSVMIKEGVFLAVNSEA